MELGSLSPLSRVGKGLADRRFTVSTSSILEHCGEIFEQFFGFPAENEFTQKLLFRREYSAVRNGVKYSATQTGTWLDLAVSLGADQAGSPFVPTAMGPSDTLKLPDLVGGFAVLASTPESVRASFCQSAVKLVATLPEVQRLALGEHYLWHADSKRAAYAKLNGLLPALQLNPDHSSDFFYRINRLREIPIGEKRVPVNRVTEWSAPGLLMQIKQNDVDTTTTMAFAASARPDINTAPSFDLRGLNGEELGWMTSSLFELAAELAERGDVP